MFIHGERMSHEKLAKEDSPSKEKNNIPVVGFVRPGRALQKDRFVCDTEMTYVTYGHFQKFSIDKYQVPQDSPHFINHRFLYSKT